MKKGKIILIIVLVCVLIIGFISCVSSDNNSDGQPKDQGGQSDIETLDTCRQSFENQENAINDILSRHQAGQLSSQEASEKLSGLATGITNMVNMAEGCEDSEYKEAIVSLGTTYKIIADRNSKLLVGGTDRDQKDLDNANNNLDNLKKKVEESRANL